MKNIFCLCIVFVALLFSGCRTHQKIPLEGYGVVSGLKGKGDKIDKYIKNRLKEMDIAFDPGEQSNYAYVRVIMDVKKSNKKGDVYDVRVYSMLDCVSLAGGYLMQTQLFPFIKSDNTIYAMAEGPIIFPDPQSHTFGIVIKGAVIVKKAEIKK